MSVETKAVAAAATRIISWNLNGLQGILKKDINGKKNAKQIERNILNHLIKTEKPDILCLQEIKCSKKFEWYPRPDSLLLYTYVSYAEKKGYSGTMVCSREKPLNVFYGLHEFEEKEGRVITLEFGKLILVNVYVPNSGRQRERLAYRINKWEPAMRSHIKNLQITHPDKNITLIGDLNCIPKAIDMGLSTIVAGATPDEKKSFTLLLEETGMIDTFRYLHPSERKYSWLFKNTKTRGCRLDFCLVSSKLKDRIKAADILYDYLASDHLPIFVDLEPTVPSPPSINLVPPSINFDM
jgi:exodeoxyribonuclease-3